MTQDHVRGPPLSVRFCRGTNTYTSNANSGQTVSRLSPKETVLCSLPFELDPELVPELAPELVGELVPELDPELVPELVGKVDHVNSIGSHV